MTQILPLHAVAKILTATSPEVKAWGMKNRVRVMRAASTALRAVRTRNLTVLKMGLGRDSIAMLLLLIEGKLRVDGKILQPCDVDAVVFTDPGAEWSNTYALIPRVAEICERHGLRFIVQSKPPEEVWRPFVESRTARRLLARAEAPKMIYSAIERRKREGRSQRKGSVAFRSDEPERRLYVGQIAAGVKGFAVVEPGEGRRPRVIASGLTEAEAKKVAQKELEVKVVKLPAETPPWRASAEGTVEEKAARGYYHERAPIMAEYAGRQALVKKRDESCTIVHKITPMLFMLADMQVERFGLLDKVSGSKVRDEAKIQLEAWAEAGNPPHVMLIGIAADEQERAVECRSPWERAVYPLLDMGITKAGETPILKRHGFNDVKKSGCRMCKFQPIAWYWALSVTAPSQFDEVVAYEKQALTMSKENLILGQVAPSEGWKGDPLKRKGLTIDEAVRVWAEVNVPSNATTKEIEALVESVLSKAYKMCSRGDSSLVKEAEPTPPPDVRKNPLRPSLRAMFTADVTRLMETLQADGFDLSVGAEADI